MFKTDRTPWKMHLLPSDLAGRCFRVLYRWVILGGWVKKNRSKQYVKLNLVLKHALVLEFLRSDEIFLGGPEFAAKQTYIQTLQIRVSRDGVPKKVLSKLYFRLQKSYTADP